MLKSTTLSKLEFAKVKVLDIKHHHSRFHVDNIASKNTKANCVKNIIPKDDKNIAKVSPPRDNACPKFPDPKTINHCSDNDTLQRCDSKNNGQAHLNRNAKRCDFFQNSNKDTVSHTSESSKSRNNYGSTFKNRLWPLCSEHEVNPRSHCHDLQEINQVFQNKLQINIPLRPNIDKKSDQGLPIETINSGNIPHHTNNQRSPDKSHSNHVVEKNLGLHGKHSRP